MAEATHRHFCTGAASISPSCCGALPCPSLPSKGHRLLLHPHPYSELSSIDTGLTAPSFPSIQVLSYKNKHLTQLKPGSFPPPAFSSSVGQRILYLQFIRSLFTSEACSPHLLTVFYGQVALAMTIIAVSLTTNTMNCPWVVTQSTTVSGY